MRASRDKYVYHWENSRDGMTPGEYWIGSRQLPFRLRKVFPISIFIDGGIVDENYVSLYYDAFE